MLDWQLLAKRARTCGWPCLQALLVQHRFICLPTSQAQPSLPMPLLQTCRSCGACLTSSCPACWAASDSSTRATAACCRWEGMHRRWWGIGWGWGTLPTPCLSAFLASHTPDATPMSLTFVRRRHAPASAAAPRRRRACWRWRACTARWAPVRVLLAHCAPCLPAMMRGCAAASCLPAGLHAAALFMCPSCHIISPVPLTLTHLPAGHALHPAAHQGRGAVRPAPQDCAGKHCRGAETAWRVDCVWIACSSSMCRWLPEQQSRPHLHSTACWHADRPPCTPCSLPSYLQDIVVEPSPLQRTLYQEFQESQVSASVPGGWLLAWLGWLRQGTW